MDFPSKQELGISHSDDEDLVDNESTSSGNAQDEIPPEDYDHHREGLLTGDAYKLCFWTQPTEALEQFLEAKARAAALMSKLKIMAVSMGVRACPRTNYQTESFDFVYEAKGYSRPSSETPKSAATISWRVPHEWKMGSSLEMLWREVLGPDSVMSFEYW